MVCCSRLTCCPLRLPRRSCGRAPAGQLPWSQTLNRRNRLCGTAEQQHRADNRVAPAPATTWSSTPGAASAARHLPGRWSPPWRCGRPGSGLTQSAQSAAGSLAPAPNMHVSARPGAGWQHWPCHSRRTLSRAKCEHCVPNSPWPSNTPNRACAGGDAKGEGRGEKGVGVPRLQRPRAPGAAGPASHLVRVAGHIGVDAKCVLIWLVWRVWVVAALRHVRVAQCVACAPP